jgi:hypothetical protein
VTLHVLATKSSFSFFLYPFENNWLILQLLFCFNFSWWEKNYHFLFHKVFCVRPQTIHFNASSFVNPHVFEATKFLINLHPRFLCIHGMHMLRDWENNTFQQNIYHNSKYGDVATNHESLCFWSQETSHQCTLETSHGVIMECLCQEINYLSTKHLPQFRYNGVATMVLIFCVRSSHLNNTPRWFQEMWPWEGRYEKHKNTNNIFIII